MTYLEFDQIRLDAFREINSIATGNAATSLSTILGRKVNITVPSIMVERLEKVPELLGGREKTMAVIYFSVSGQFSGSILLIFSSSDCLGLANALTGQKATKIENLDEMGLSALKETGNIVIGSFMRVLSYGLKVKIRYSIPGFAYDMLGSILDEILTRLSLEAEHAVIMESEFIMREKAHRGHLIFILAPRSVDAIIKALGSWKK